MVSSTVRSKGYAGSLGRSQPLLHLPKVSHSCVLGPQRSHVRISPEEHLAHDWRIHEVAAPLELEDVWSLPVHGDAEDFGRFVELVTQLDPMQSDSVAARFLWAVRDRLGS